MYTVDFAKLYQMRTLPVKATSYRSARRCFFLSSMFRMPSYPISLSCKVEDLQLLFAKARSAPIHSTRGCNFYGCTSCDSVAEMLESTSCTFQRYIRYTSPATSFSGFWPGLRKEVKLYDGSLLQVFVSYIQPPTARDCSHLVIQALRLSLHVRPRFDTWGNETSRRKWSEYKAGFLRSNRERSNRFSARKA